MNKKDKTKKIVKKHYDEVADSQSGCCSCSSCGDDDVSSQIGYSDKELKDIKGADMGLGCGNPTGLGEINKGETVLDLGSGPGLDCFLAAKRVGEDGKVIGVDMSEKMIELAEQNKEKYDYQNVEFKAGEIEDLPIEDESINVVISNCVVNLSPDKQKVFDEVKRVLKPGGRLYLSDIVLLEELTEEQKQDEQLLAGCVGGALLVDDYLEKIKKAGFKVKVLDEDKEISKRQYEGINLESIKLEAKKR